MKGEPWSGSYNQRQRSQIQQIVKCCVDLRIVSTEINYLVAANGVYIFDIAFLRTMRRTACTY